MLKEVLNIAMGRKGYTHERLEQIEKIMFPNKIQIDGRAVDERVGPKWGEAGWSQGKVKRKDGVGGIAGIWHSNNAGGDLGFWIFGSRFLRRSREFVLDSGVGVY